MASPRLTVCIPTYNRAGYLKEAVESVARQAKPGVEIVVSDNSSSDGSLKVLEGLAKAWPCVRFQQQETNLGADRNYLAAVAMARSDYCWLLGSDDRLPGGAIDRVLSVLDGSADVLLVDRVNMSKDFSVVRDRERFLNAPTGSVFGGGNVGSLVELFQGARSLGGVFSYISAIIVRKKAWDAQPVRDEFLGSAWIHVAKLMDVLRTGGTLQYVAEPLVENRTGNDSFASTLGYARRRALDFDYVRVVETIFPKTPALHRAVRDLLTREYFNLPRMLSDRRTVECGGGKAELAILEEAYRQMRGSRNYRTKMWVWKHVPHAVVQVAYLASRNLRQVRARVSGSAVGER